MLKTMLTTIRSGAVAVSFAALGFAGCDPQGVCVVVDDEELCVPRLFGDGYDDGYAYDDYDYDDGYASDVEPAFSDGGCFGFAPADFSFPADELACEGEQFVRYDVNHGRFFGVVTCAPAVYRLYISDAAEGPYYAATDTAGHGQDQCELIHPGFSLGDEDNIDSGSCPECTTSVNLPLEGVTTFARAEAGESFQLTTSGDWSWQTSQLGCGFDITRCAPTAVN